MGFKPNGTMWYHCVCIQDVAATKPHLHHKRALGHSLINVLDFFLVDLDLAVIWGFGTLHFSGFPHG